LCLSTLQARRSARVCAPPPLTGQAPLFAQLFDRCWLQALAGKVENGVAPLQKLGKPIASFGSFGFRIVGVDLIADAFVRHARLPAIRRRDVQDADVAVVLTRWSAAACACLFPVST